MDSYMTPTEYIETIRSLGKLAVDTELESIKNLLIELTTVSIDDACACYVISENLMARIAIVNMCDATIAQLHNSSGECDYAGLGRHSKNTVRSIMRAIYTYVP